MSDPKFADNRFHPRNHTFPLTLSEFATQFDAFLDGDLEISIDIDGRPLSKCLGVRNAADGFDWTFDLKATVSKGALLIISVSRTDGSRIGEVYVDLEDLWDHNNNGEFRADGICADGDGPSFQLRFDIHGGNRNTSVQSSFEMLYNELDDFAFLHLVLEIVPAVRPRVAELTTLLSPDAALALESRAKSLPPSSVKSDIFKKLGDACTHTYEETQDAHLFNSALTAYTEMLDHYHLNDAYQTLEESIQNNVCHTTLIQARVLAERLLGLYVKSNDPKLLARALALSKLTIAHPTAYPAEQPIFFFTFADCLLKNASHTNHLPDLDLSIAIASNGIEDPAKHQTSRWLFILAEGLQLRFQMLHLRDDLERGIGYLVKAIAQPEEGTGYMARHLRNLGEMFQLRYEVTGERRDAQQAIEAAVMAGKMYLQLGHDTRNDALACYRLLGEVHLGLYEKHGDVRDIDQCVVMAETASKAAHGTGEWPRAAARLAYLLWRRHKTSNASAPDLAKAIGILEEALPLLTSKAGQLQAKHTLAGAYSDRFMDYSGDPEDCLRAIDLYSSCALEKEHRIQNWRFKAAVQWITCSHYIRLHPFMVDHVDKYPAVAIAACCAAVDAYCEMLWIGLPLRSRHDVLKGEVQGTDNKSFGQLALSAILMDVYMVGEYGLALELLERGRSASWSQLLGLRVSLGGVRAVDAALADKMCDIAKILQFTGAQHDYASAPNESVYAREEMAGNRHRLLVNEWNNSVEEVRKLPGCERFLLPKTVDELMLAAKDGPVVVITPVGRRTNVLILLPGAAEPLYVELEDFDEESAHRLRKSLHRALGSDLGMRAKRSRSGSLNPWGEADDWIERDGTEALFEDILSELWYKVVRPIFDAIAIANPPDIVQDRIFWCPTGELSLLPLHAAGDYTRAERGHKIYEFVVSSYIPTISSLLNAQRTPNTLTAPHILAVAVAQPTGQVHIGGTKQEIQYVRSHFSDDGDKQFEEVSEGYATRESVLHSMRDASWVHFACHGVQDVSEPTKSALLLTGTEEITLEDLIRMDLPQAQFAFLSACQTATGSDTLPEDSIHIASGMLMAGYKGVIGTIWSVFDRDAPEVARDVYGYLLRKQEGTPDYKDAAMALHLAVEKLRKRAGTKAYLAWVPFIHIGS